MAGKPKRNVEIKIKKPVHKGPDGIFTRSAHNDLELTTDIRSAIMKQHPHGGSMIIWAVLGLLIVGLIWAYFSEIDEVTRGRGKVIPSGQVQVVQNLEGGIVKEVLVREGDIVKKGDPLLRIDDTRFSAPFMESQVKYFALKAKIARLQAESLDVPLVIPEDIMAAYPDIGNREKELYESRQKEYQAKINILKEQAIQRSSELEELKSRKLQLQRRYQLIAKELNLTAPLVKEGAVSEVEVLRLRRQVTELKGELDATTLAIPRVASYIDQAKTQIEEQKLKFRNAAKAELNEAYSMLESLSVSSVALEDRLNRTLVQSPVYGTIKQVMVNTIGGVIQPGMDLVEIVPLDDTLLVEARIKPSDIAFLRPKQKAIVKFTAYDFTIYGGLDAELEHISADSLIDEKGNSYYLVKVRTTKNYLGTEDNPLPIIPGMITSVDILTGKKSVLSYLLKPALRAKSLALRER
jgi:adhesin transport system membrane fusion protein